MSCPICGADCRCRNRGPGGICCSCHRHKVRGLTADFTIAVDERKLEQFDEDTRKSIEQHLEWMKQTLEGDPQGKFPFAAEARTLR